MHHGLLHLVEHDAGLSFEDQEQVGVLVALAQDPGAFVDPLVPHRLHECGELLGREVGEESEPPQAFGERLRRGLGHYSRGTAWCTLVSGRAIFRSGTECVAENSLVSVPSDGRSSTAASTGRGW